MYIPIILGTAREGRQSEKVAKYLLDQVKANGHDSEIIDVREFRQEATDNSSESKTRKKYLEKITDAEGIILASPEYNHGYPGELKMMLDMAYQEYFGKPIGICGVSSGGLGGARVVEQLRLVVIEFHMIPLREAVYFSGVTELFNESGKIKDESYHERVKVMLKEMESHLS
jgi:NAD(P)H-dependent FMN reductase